MLILNSGTSAINVIGLSWMIVAQTWPLSRKLPGLTICSKYPEKGAFTSVRFNSTIPRLHSMKSFSTNWPCLAPILTTSPEVWL